MSLQQYRQKRDFGNTAEPAGQATRRSRTKQLSFVVQKHAATQLHYDFRLEMDGVLKSWAVPKGIPLRKGERRLAVQVEDHPLEYANFEGTIPPGNYGSGTVMVWDRGHYQVQGRDPLDGLAEGKLHLKLSGKKLKGEWALVRMRHPRQEGKEEWLLLKVEEDAAPLAAQAEDQSALTRRTLKQIAAANDAQWHSDRTATRASRMLSPAMVKARSHRSRRPVPATSGNGAARAAISKDLRPATPQFVEPMKALLVRNLPKGSDWIYEVKFDGVRALALKERDAIRLLSRNANDLTERYSSVAEALESLPAQEATLDGEIVAIDPQGRSSFELLQSFLKGGKEKPPLVYYVFDLLNLDGKDLTSLPLVKRKELLEHLIENSSETIRFSTSLQANPGRLVKEMQKRGLEGIVAKLKSSKYQSGRRSGSWAKYKWTHEQEFVIGGYTPPKGTRTEFGAILVGYYQDKKLLFASKVGSGFDGRTLASLSAQFQKLIRKSCPFANLPEPLLPGMTASKMRTCTWLQPKLVCQIRFSEWTRDHHLRQPIYLGLRDDKKPSQVIREEPKNNPSS